VPPTFCRISLRYIQQKAGVPHKGVSQKIASEFSEIHICGAQPRPLYPKKYYLKFDIIVSYLKLEFTMLALKQEQLFDEINILPIDLKTKIVDKILASITPTNTSIDAL
jgi:hypothetical protein